MSVEQMLESMRADWEVDLSSVDGGWRLAVELGARFKVRAKHVYRGTSLSSVVSRAWAGEKGDDE